MKKLLGVLLMLIVVSPVACIFGPTSKRVMSYRNQNVYLTDRDKYTVGELESPWRRIRVGVHSIAFYHPDLYSTIATDAFCGPSYEDSPLKTLTAHLLAGVEDGKTGSQEEFMLDGRVALRTKASGKIDGVPLSFDIVVLKKNQCIVDFMCIVPEGGASAAKSDFERFFGGFRYE